MCLQCKLYLWKYILPMLISCSPWTMYKTRRAKGNWFCDCSRCSMILFVILVASPVAIQATYYQCHDDPTFEAEPGILREVQFTWLAGLQYIHLQTGRPHYYRVPRVVLVTKRFALSTANDAANLPENYALGNVIFGDYERDEQECETTPEEIANGVVCEPTMLLMPIADVLVHPEYKHFHVKNSVALIKLVKDIASNYMLPICLPYSDFTSEKFKDKIEETGGYFHLDFSMENPRVFPLEDKLLSLLKLVPREKCHDLDERHGNASDIRVACSDGCGYRSGAPTFVHADTGHWTLVALAQGNVACEDPWYRPQLAEQLSSHTLIFPYVEWITKAISMRVEAGGPGRIIKNDPFGIVAIPRAYVGLHDVKEKGWVGTLKDILLGKWWIGGLACYDHGEFAAKHFRFYHEVFQIIPNGDNYINYYIELVAPPDVVIICIKIGIPFRLGSPKIWGLNNREVQIRIRLYKFYVAYKFEIEAYGDLK